MLSGLGLEALTPRSTHVRKKRKYPVFIARKGDVKPCRQCGGFFMCGEDA
jgi:hypothetical protein